jgi:hypothetical protein
VTSPSETYTVAQRTPHRPGWWWVGSGQEITVEGWVPVLVTARRNEGLGFVEPCRGGWVSIHSYAWGGPCVMPGADLRRLARLTSEALGAVASGDSKALARFPADVCDILAENGIDVVPAEAAP